MDNGNPSRVNGGRRRAESGGRGSHRAGPRDAAAPGAGRHRAAGALSFQPGRFHLIAAAAGCLVIAIGIAVGTSLFRPDDPGYSAGNEEAAPLLYANGEAAPADFTERNVGLSEEIYAELEARYGITADELYDGEGGYRVVLTLDRDLQEAAEEAAEANAPGGVVAVEPGSGAVLCYYGGEDASSADQAGVDSPHPPASVFDMVIAATALENGASTESWWSGEDADMTLTEAVRESRSAAIDSIATEYGAEAVLNTAIGLGLSAMADKAGTVHTFEEGEAGDGADAFDPADFGSYGVSVLDMAAVYATIAGDGVHAPTHFVERVVDGTGNTLEPDTGIPTDQAVRSDTARDLQFVGLGTGGAIEDRDSFGLSGTWSDETEDSWYVGAIPQLSVAAWVGGADSEGEAGLPVWQEVMGSAIDVMEYEPESWPGAAGAGSDLTDGIENGDGTIDPDSEYCQANPDAVPCGGDEPTEEEPTEDDPPGEDPTEDEPTEDDSPGEDPTEEEPTEEEPSDEPTEDEPTEDCGGWFEPPCP